MEREEGRRATGGSGSGSRPTPSVPPGSDRDDSELVERVRAGSRRDFDTLVRRHQQSALTVARRIVGSREEAEDVVQESFMKALDRIDSFQLGRPFAPWFLRIVANDGLNRRKRMRRRPSEPMPEEFPGDAESPEQQAERRRVRELVYQALDGLSEKQRLVVGLFELDGYSGREIAEALGMQEGTIRWTLHEARRKLRALLMKPGGESGDG